MKFATETIQTSSPSGDSIIVIEKPKLVNIGLFKKATVRIVDTIIENVLTS